MKIVLLKFFNFQGFIYYIQIILHKSVRKLHKSVQKLPLICQNGVVLDNDGQSNRTAALEGL